MYILYYNIIYTNLCDISYYKYLYRILFVFFPLVDTRAPLARHRGPFFVALAEGPSRPDSTEQRTNEPHGATVQGGAP